MNKPLFLLIPALVCTSCSSFASSDLNNYVSLLKSCRDNSDFHTQLYIFPENTDKGTPTNFLFKTTEDLLNGSYLFYLVMTYDEETFNQELDRLSKIEGHFSEFNATKKILHYENDLLFLTINRNNCYEYAKYNKNNYEIAYVSNQLYSWATTGVAVEHRLNNITIPTNLDDGENSYNMYYFYTDEPDGMGGTLHVGVYVDD